MQKVRILNSVGFILFAVGAVYAMLPHTLHVIWRLLPGLSHLAHTLIGAGVVLFSIFIFVTVENIRRRSEQKKKLPA